MPDFKEFKDDIFDKDDKKDDTGKSRKKKFKVKSPWFIAGLIGVIILVIYNKMKERSTETTYTVPTGYSGYPEMSGAVSTDTGYYDSALDTMASEMNTALDAIYKENDTNIKNLVNEWDNQNKAYESTIDELSQQIDTFDKKYTEVMEVVDTQSEMLAYQSIITQMQANSDKALITNSQSEKDYLHNLNSQLADSIGATFNDNDGYWYKDGKRLYSTALQSSKAQSVNTSVGSSGGGTSSSSYSDVIAQMEANSKAYKTATTQAQKDALYKENQSLGKSIGLNYDDASGKWKTSSGADAWNYNQPAYTGGGGSSSSITVKSASSGSTSSKSTSSSSSKSTSSSSSKSTSSSSSKSTSSSSSSSNWSSTYAGSKGLSQSNYNADGSPKWMK